MSKAAAVVGIGTTGTVLAVGGSYMLGVFDSAVDLEIPETLEKLKEGPKIIRNQFPTLTFKSEGDDWATSKPADNFLGTSADKGMGRLVVNWEKYKSTSGQSDNKWSGSIRWLWTFANDNKGLILYLSAKPSSSEDSKLSVEGIIYALSREKDSEAWQIKHNKKLDTNSSTISEVDNKLPTVGDTFTTSLKVKDYWGFLDSSNNTLIDLCKSDTINKTNAKSTETFRGSWTWKKGSGEGQTQKLFDWSKVDHQWVNTLFGNPQPKLDSLFGNFSGIWNEEYFVNKNLGVKE